MTKEFHSLNEIQKYYYEKSNTYIFIENGEYIDLVVFNFDLEINANIDAGNINAFNIEARNIKAWDIDARDLDVLDIDAYDIKVNNIDCSNIEAINIEAQDISYYAVCFAYNNIKCKSIKGRRNNAKHFVLDGKMEAENEH